MFSQTDAEFLERLKYLETGAGKLFIVVPSSASYFSELVSQSYPGRVVNSLNRAISLCSSGRGDTVLMLPGDHTEGSPADGANSALMDKDAVTLMGFGPHRTTYTADDSLNSIAINADGCTVSGLRIDCDHAANGGLYVTGADGLLVENCWFIETTPFGYGIHFDLEGTETVANVMIRGCRFVDNVNGILVDTEDTAKIVGMTIEDCEFHHAATAAISDLGSTGSACLDILIKGCSFLDNAKIFDFDVFANQGMITQCIFDVAANTALLIGDVDDETHFIANYTLVGLSIAQPVT